MHRDKVVYREVSTEGSEAAKSGTDEQEFSHFHCEKWYMRLSAKGKLAHHSEARSQQVAGSRYPEIGGRKKLLPGEVCKHFRNVNAEVSRGRSSYRQRAATQNQNGLKAEASQSNEGLNVEQLQILNGDKNQPSESATGERMNEENERVWN